MPQRIKARHDMNKALFSIALVATAITAAATAAFADRLTSRERATGKVTA